MVSELCGEQVLGTGVEMMSELKRCPFCGGKARLMTYDTYGSHYVKCDNVSCGIVTWIHTTEEEAVEAWNKMATDELYTRKEYGE